MDQQPRIVFVNMAHCWQCGKYLAPSEAPRRRLMQTGVARHRGFFRGTTEQYGPVSLCVACDETLTAAERRQHQKDMREALLCVGGIGMLLFLCAMGAPWWCALLVVGLLACSGTLWWAIAATCVVSAVFEGTGIHPLTNPATTLPVFVVAIVGTVVAKAVEVRRRKKAKSGRQAAPHAVRQAKLTASVGTLPETEGQLSVREKE